MPPARCLLFSCLLLLALASALHAGACLRATAGVGHNQEERKSCIETTMLPTHSSEKLVYPVTSPTQRSAASRATGGSRAKRSTSSGTLHLDPGEEYFISQTGIKYLLVFLVVVILYLVLRVSLAEPTDARRITMATPGASAGPI